MGGEGNDGQLRAQLRDLGSYLLALAERREDDDTRDVVAAIGLGNETSRSGQIDDSLRLQSVAREEYRRRRARANHFDANLFAEPAWDILLDLFVAHVDQVRISVTSACLASSCPPTTALRWVSVLEAQGLVRRTGDTTDQRRTWVALTELGVRKMTAYLRGKVVSAVPHHAQCA